MTISSASNPTSLDREAMIKLEQEKLKAASFDESWRRTRLEHFNYLIHSTRCWSAFDNPLIASRYLNRLKDLDPLEVVFLPRAELVEDSKSCTVDPEASLKIARTENQTVYHKYTISNPSSAWSEFDCYGKSEIFIRIESNNNSFIKLKLNALEGAHINSTVVINANKGVLRLNLESDFLSKHSQATVTIIAMCREDAHVDICNKQLHYVPACKSDTLFKFVSLDKSYVTFWGLIDVEAGCQESDAYQLARGLLVSEMSRADLIPNLRIKANNVRCTHGASYSVLDQSSKFYLESRCIKPSEAERILIQGFLLEAVERVPEQFREESERFILDQRFGTI